MTKHNHEIILYGGIIINTDKEIIDGENGIMVDDDNASYYIPYTSITLIKTTRKG